jgi:signal peptidase II
MNNAIAPRTLLVRVLVVTTLVALLDQISKTVITQEIGVHDTIVVIPGFFHLILTYNRGAAFGIFGGLPDTVRYLVLGVTTVGAIAAVVYFLVREFRNVPSAHIALAAILGGALGNLIDRLRLGAVIDFLDFFWGTYHWPAFNIADSAICVGVAWLLILQLFNPVVAPIRGSRPKGGNGGEN